MSLDPNNMDGGHAMDGGGRHVPVLVEEVLEALAIRPGACVVDATVGQGGHTERLLQAVGPTGWVIGLDVDEDNLAHARRRLAGAERLRLFHENFENLPNVLKELNLVAVDGILADLGVSSNQLTDPRRGFSFADDGPLDMRLGGSASRTAADLVNGLSESELANLIYENSQERFSRRIARAICQARRAARITTTARLAEIVCRALKQDPHSHPSKIHPATRTFMALRIAVNRELEVLERFLDNLPGLLNPGGRAAIISFHSLEDGACKRAFRRMAAAGEVRLVNRKPITPSESERKENPRSRSAKLRAIEKL